MILKAKKRSKTRYKTIKTYTRTSARETRSAFATQNRPNGLALASFCQPSAWLDAGKSWLLPKKQDFVGSFDLLLAFGGLAGEVMAGSDFKARGTVLLRQAW
jgi:hypothetical protein